MAVIVLEERVLAVVVGIKCLTVFGAFYVRDFIELNDGVVTAPGPDAGSVILAPLSSTINTIVFDKAAVAAPRFYAVAADRERPQIPLRSVRTT
ncbi:MAG: hypothetical protein ACYSXD_01810 [Planctomycetota bacterium]